MKNIVKVNVLFVTLLFSTFVSAKWSTSLGYANYDNRELGVIYGSLGKEYDSGDFSFMPELRVGFGVKDSELNQNASVLGEASTLEVDTFVSASVRAQYNVTDSFGIFAQPSYSRRSLSLSGDESGETVSSDRSEFDIGLGVSYDFSDEVSAELIYETLYSDDLVSAAFRYRF